jgi:hypothetical protein
MSIYNECKEMVKTVFCLHFALCNRKLKIRRFNILNFIRFEEVK